MNVNVTVRVTPNVALVPVLSHGANIQAHLRRMAERAADDLRQSAPARTGAGRASITGGTVMTADGWVGTAGWDRAHYYMGIQQSRTHWADPAFQRVRYV